MLARDAFIVGCVEHNLSHDLSAVRWESGKIKLDHFGLGDELVAALSARWRVRASSFFLLSHTIVAAWYRLAGSRTCFVVPAGGASKHFRLPDQPLCLF